MSDASADLLTLDGSAAPPRSNGELVFAEPWETQAFGLALALHQCGVFEWEDFRRHLIAEIAAWEQGPRVESWSYYRCWLAALEHLLDDQGVIGPAEIGARAHEIVEAEFRHDHDHEHGHHDHDHHDHAH